MILDKRLDGLERNMAAAKRDVAEIKALMEDTKVDTRGLLTNKALAVVFLAFVMLTAAIEYFAG